MGTAFTLLWLLHLPCLPGELASPSPEPQAAPETQPLPPPPPPPPPPPIKPERAVYKVSYGLLGEIATVELSLSHTPCPDGATKTVLRGAGKGDVLGFGKMDKHLESELDAAHRVPTRFVSRRVDDGKLIVDTAVQDKPGAVSTKREKPGEASNDITLSRTQAILDPLAFLLRVRLDIPTQPTSYELLDGRGFWRFTLSQEPCADPKLIQLKGKAEMLYLDGNVDPNKTSRKFTLFLAKDRHHIPVKLVLRMGLGDVRAELLEFSPQG